MLEAFTAWTDIFTLDILKQVRLHARVLLQLLSLFLLVRLLAGFVFLIHDSSSSMLIHREIVDLDQGLA